MTILRRFVRSALWVAALAVFAIAGGTNALAQATTGTISGTVTDATGAAVSGATVTLTNTDRGQDLRTLTTDNAGFYTAPSLPLGTYSVKVAAKSFKTATVTGLVLHVNDTLTVNRQLVIGSSSQEVTVQAEAVQWRTTPAFPTAQASLGPSAQIALSPPTTPVGMLVQLVPCQ